MSSRTRSTKAKSALPLCHFRGCPKHIHHEDHDYCGKCHKLCCDEKGSYEFAYCSQDRCKFEGRCDHQAQGNSHYCVHHRCRVCSDHIQYDVYNNPSDVCKRHERERILPDERYLTSRRR